MSIKPAFEVVSDETRNERVRVLHVTGEQVELAIKAYVKYGLDLRDASGKSYRFTVDSGVPIQGVTVRVVEDYSRLPTPDMFGLENERFRRK